MARQTRADVPRPGSASACKKPANAFFTRASSSTAAADASGAQIGRKLSAGIDVGNDQSRDIVAIRSGQHDVAHERRAMRDQRHAQRSDADPGPGRELEILGNSSVEKQALGGIGGVLEPHRVADFVKSLLVEGGRGDGGRTPIAGRDVGPSKPGLELALLWERV